MRFFMAVSLAMISLLALCFGNLSILICGTLYTAFTAWIANKLFGQNVRLFQRLALIWAVSMVFLAVVYGLYSFAYGMPYDMRGLDDYFYDVVWSDDCLAKGYFTIGALNRAPEYCMHNSKAYLLLIVWMKRLFGYVGGYHTMDIRFMNLMFLTLSGLLMGKYGEVYMKLEEKTVIRILTVISLFPNAMFITSLVYRDTLVACMLVLTFYLWAGSPRRRIKENIWILAVTGVLAYWTYYCRKQAVLYLAVSVGVGLWNDRPRKHVLAGRLHLGKLVVVSGILAGVVVLGDVVLASLVRFVTSYGQIFAKGGGIQAKLYGIPLFPFGWLLRILFFLVSPMYGDIVTAGVTGDPISFLRGFVSWGTVYLIFLYPYVFRYLKKMDNAAVVCFTILVSVAVVTSGFRHVMMVYPWMITIGLAAKSQSSPKYIQESRVLSAAALGVGGIAFVLLKWL